MVASRHVATQERGHETQRRVIEGAAEVFRRSGYGEASLRSIAAASGVSLGSMNFHFRSKEQIALTVIEEQHRRVIALARRVMADHETVIEQLIHLSRAVASQLMADPIVAAGVELSMEVGDFTDPAKRSYDGWSQMFEELLAGGLESGEFVSELGAAELAEIYLGCFAGVQLLSRIRSDRSELLRALHSLWLVILDGLVPSDRMELARKTLDEAFSPEALENLTR